MKRTFGILGGDARFTELARLIREDGHTVYCWGVPELRGTSAASGTAVTDANTDANTKTNNTAAAPDTALSAEVIILPLPLCKSPGLLNCTNKSVPLESLFRQIRPGSRVLAGQVPESLCRLARERGIQLTDYFRREPLLIANAAATADAAAALLVTETGETLAEKRCLVLGFGRIGTLLCRRLRGMGGRVTAAARRTESRAWIRASGFHALDIGTLSERLAEFDVICNTVPASVLDAALLTELSPGCVLAELASRPGFDADAAAARGLRPLSLRSLPGRVVPRTAGRILRDTIVQILAEDTPADNGDGIPHSTGDNPHNEDNISHSMDDMPYSGDNTPNNANNIPHNEGDTPHSGDHEFHGGGGESL